ncbi:MAG: hypothetical protein H8D56_14150 [Planctomycetes bacterium]|nr:hypothetical protein [Planctomycetota bacterium]MBL7145603.1 hypothetical protein [Phycisphaerae bacterium]
MRFEDFCPEDHGKDLNWILSQQKLEGYFVDPFSSYPKIQQTWYAVQSLKKLEALDLLAKSKLPTLIRALLRDAKVDIFETVYGIEILYAIGELDRQICVDGYKRFVESWSTRIQHLPVGPNLFLLDFYSRLLKMTKDIHIEKSKAIMKKLSERVSSAFDSYLGI